MRRSLPGRRVTRAVLAAIIQGSTLTFVELASNRQIEDAAIAHVLALEAAAGRTAVDTRGSGGLADIEGDRLIEVKAYGRSARGSDLWLEPRQVEAARANPLRFHLMIVENVRQGDPAGFQVLDITGELLGSLLERKREKRYFEVPFPVAVYDSLRMQAD